MNYIDDFFSELAKETDRPAKIILTGAMAGILLGSIRPSMDIDFEIEISSLEKTDGAEKMDAAIAAVSSRLKFPAQYSENIQGWGQISFLDYREKAVSYKKFGSIDVYFLAPEHWTIGKMSRYLPLDQMDVSCVLKKKSINWEKMVGVWGLALKNSALSDKSREFKNHVMDFLKEEGTKIWGKDFEAEKAIALFREKAGIKA